MLTVTFFSNFLNHHQLPLALEFYNNENVCYHFIATEPLPKERLELGYEDMNSKYPFVVRTYESKQSYNRAMQLANESDVVIIGSAPEEFVTNRIAANKLTFRYYERIFRKGRIWAYRPKNIKNLYPLHTKYRDKNLYMLCASAYTAGDFACINSYVGKTYKWGYFPEIKKYDIDEILSQKPQKLRITWVARFLKLKHPEKMITLGKKLKKDNIPFEIIMIGEGKEKNKIRKKIEKNNLTCEIKLLGSLPHEKVREEMEKSNIFIFTSDKREGWGAVINEAMNSACTIIANDEIGSVPFLIKNGENGLVVHKNSNKEIYNYVKEVSQHPEKMQILGRNAYISMMDIWNAKVAASRFLKLVSNIQQGRKENDIKEGPCSKAEII